MCIDSGELMPRQTYFAKAGDVTPRWHHVDAQGKVLGRMATEIATVLMGKVLMLFCLVVLSALVGYHLFGLIFSHIVIPTSFR